MMGSTDFDPVIGDHLKDWGHRPGKQFPALLERANDMRAEGYGLVKIRAELDSEIPEVPPALDLRALGTVPFHENIRADHPTRRQTSKRCARP